MQRGDDFYTATGAVLRAGNYPVASVFNWREPLLASGIAALSDLVRNEGAAALIATHNMELAKYMDRVMALDHGRLVQRS